MFDCCDPKRLTPPPKRVVRLRVAEGEGGVECGVVHGVGDDAVPAGVEAGDDGVVIGECEGGEARGEGLGVEALEVEGVGGGR